MEYHMIQLYFRGVHEPPGQWVLVNVWILLNAWSVFSSNVHLGFRDGWCQSCVLKRVGLKASFGRVSRNTHPPNLYSINQFSN